jgi:hypothetical protein
MIKLKINVLAVDKNRLYKGAKGTYLDCVLIETKNNQFGDDYMIAQEVTKEEREKGVKGPILGNAKIIGQKPAAQQAPAATQTTTVMNENLDEDVPF